MDTNIMETFDCVVIGAGWFGLAAAKQYHTTNPDSSLAVFETAPSLGGTWATHRLYPDLRTNNLHGTYEYPDFPMDSATFGVKTGEHIPGTVVNAYLNAYAAKFHIADLIRFNTKVTAAKHCDIGGWELSIGEGERVFARRLILATGLTSTEFLPHFEGQETFGGLIFHSKHFLQNKDTIEQCKSVTVFGGGKFAWDAVYLYAMAGVKVNWVIRSSGHGPCWMTQPLISPLKLWLEELGNIRFLTWFSPCIFGQTNMIEKFLHGTRIGRFIVNCYWNIMSGWVTGPNKYDSHPDTAKLKPWIPIMWTGPTFSILNYDTDIFEVIKGDNVRVHIGDIDHLSPGKVHLLDGTEFESEVLLSNTGWKHVPAMQFLPAGIEKELGLPHAWMEAAPAEDLANQQTLITKADEEIFHRFPCLKEQPVWNENYSRLDAAKGDRSSSTSRLTPYMLHRFIVPPSPRFLQTRDIAFSGMVACFSNPIDAHIQGLWISSYFSGRLANNPCEAVGDEGAMARLQYQTVLHNRYGKWRYPTDWGDRSPAFFMDAVPYYDVLLKDLGLVTKRKRGFWSELLTPYRPGDYGDIIEEWKGKGGFEVETRES